MNYQHAQASTLLSYISSTSGSFTHFPSTPFHLVNLIALGECRARTLAYCIRRRLLPPEIRNLFGGVAPSAGHGMRICKILRSEWKRQARLFRDLLFFRLHSADTHHIAQKKWRDLCVITSRTTEFIWQHALVQLRAFSPKKVSPPPSNPVHSTCDVPLPDSVKRVLRLGPKFAVEPQKSPPELLTLVRQVARRAPESETERCVSEGVHVLSQPRPPRKSLPVNSVVKFFKEQSLSLLTADKEGGFAVLPNSELDSKATSAITSVFNCRNDISLSKVRNDAKKLCNALNLQRLASSIGNCKKLSLDIFFTVKTHKIDWPLRVIVSENGTWQKAVALFLQSKLNLLTIDDPFLVRDSNDIIAFISSSDKGFNACSIDIKDLYYSLPHDTLLRCVECCIDDFGSIAFQNATGISVTNFLALLGLYLKSTFASWNNSTYIQKSGVCIGSCIAPILSDIFLAHHDRILASRLDQAVVPKVFRFVDDFLILFSDGQKHEKLACAVADVLCIFEDCLAPLVLTHELPVDGELRFLDLKLSISTAHLCWVYEPRANKPLLPFLSAHSKLVKRGIANLCFTNALHKSCSHSMEPSLLTQASRLRSAGFPESLLVSVAEKLLKKIKQGENATTDCADEKKPLAVLPYLHKISHGLKKIGNKANVRVVFSAPDKLSGLCKRVNSRAGRKNTCTTKHRKPFVPCTAGVVYVISLTCGKKYVGQTGRCLNERLKEHYYNVNTAVQGHLGIHCRDCGCVPVFNKCEIIYRHREQLTREIVEAEQIQRLGELCISVPSVALSNNELRYLNASRLC